MSLLLTLNIFHTFNFEQGNASSDEVFTSEQFDNILDTTNIAK